MNSIIKSISVIISAINKASVGFKSKIAMLTAASLFSVVLSMLFVFFSKRVIDIATGTFEGDLFYYSVIIVLLLLSQIQIGRAHV